MAKKSAAKRIERLASIVQGAGFLLQILQKRYGSDFSTGLDEQVRQCLRDCRQVEAARLQREQRVAVEKETTP